ncbi:class I SAM-dependent methyltransferase [Actinomycetospora sp. NBRC 106378]|uniref:class I SAM-dependent methyltransferase n=1 Tax=Actinomycetospora sp. NBRC 106378 TaxID=3032208 RepID=UPI0024A28792|nr:class I SAM-dependent methyltransferase [Actinomycetospora sp. NBRC 106378]GLZ52735.1 hypothetical protein Acsp07_23520 [Actinomycetospora sp. NBRC 106378]
MAAQIDELRCEQERHFAEVSAQIEDLRVALHAREVRDRRDILAAGERDAVASSARFVRETMTGARTFPSPPETLAHALALAPRGGMALEFGVYSGTTLRQIAGDRGGAVFGFDSFEGLPEDWRAGFRAGTFAVDTLPEVDGAELVVGWFSETLPGFLDSHPGPVDLLHLDADLYSSTATVLELVGPRLRSGSVVVFDEYLNHPGWQDGEHRAWREFVAAHDVEFVYEAFTHDNEQVVVVVTGAKDEETPTAPRQVTWRHT